MVAAISVITNANNGVRSDQKKRLQTFHMAHSAPLCAYAAVNPNVCLKIAETEVDQWECTCSSQIR